MRGRGLDDRSFMVNKEKPIHSLETLKSFNLQKTDQDPEIVLLHFDSLSEKGNKAHKSQIAYDLPITANRWSNHCFKKLFKILTSRSAKFNEDNLMRKSCSITFIRMARCKQTLLK